VWSDVLHEPLPTDLRRLIDKLEQVTGGGPAAGHSRKCVRPFVGEMFVPQGGREWTRYRQSEFGR
jgi:hypothetical protein